MGRCILFALFADACALYRHLPGTCVAHLRPRTLAGLEPLREGLALWLLLLKASVPLLLLVNSFVLVLRCLSWANR